MKKTLSLPKGFSAAGIAAGIKKKKKDMALIVSDVMAESAAVFTTNQVKAAPVKWDIKVVKHDGARAIVMNSGNANACTGAQGMADVEATAALAAGKLGINSLDVFVCSTGTIGKPLPMDKIAAGIETLFDEVSPDGGMDAAEAMMTTDLVSKTVVAEIDLDGVPVRITGLAKGSGMIEPNMATMLAFILTDAAVEKHTLQCALRTAADMSFNRITVDGDRSTNDTVICLANGRAGNETITQRSTHWPLFLQTLEKVLFELSMMIVKDGEGATRVITVKVNGAASNGEAEEAARAVANSMLNKTAWAGKRPNWGRIMDAIGYSYAQVQENKVDIDYDDVPAVRGGMAAGTPEEELVAAVSKEAFTINIDLNLGTGHTVVYTCNCTEDYVRINVE
ncbi:MAG TPA: bifunctional glutamate N-acetyltransferase/amino-acid acetyltransferase ArgJ [Pontiellaceae bacterium]|nr:bifunctional glutamate N-acetyltransferase/amino-acid acetyltransferase ArgJ [Pontiellaceae bacterium]HPR83136.1 bifunctional glutamate N-acetyltransferase/amino-acid acetyltransferase ArgJ [Pontiellaceae bacterium]